MKFVWKDISMISADIFEHIFDTAQQQLILNKTNKSFELCESSMGYIWCVLI
jgi:hypothetical protein